MSGSDETKIIQDSLREMRKEYCRLHNTYADLVGAVYPAVLYGKLVAMREAYVSVGGNESDLPVTPAPNRLGRVPESIRYAEVDRVF